MAARVPVRSGDLTALHCATQAAAGLAESVRHLGAAFAGRGVLHTPALPGGQHWPIFQETLSHLHLADRWLDVAQLRLLNRPEPPDVIGPRARAARPPGNRADTDRAAPPTAASPLPDPGIPGARTAPTDAHPRQHR